MSFEIDGKSYETDEEGYLLNLAFLLIEKRLIHWSGKA